MSSPQSEIEAIGQQIRAIRTKIGWTQGELGRRAGLSQSMVSLIERGRVLDLTVRTARVLLAALGARLIVTVGAPYLADRERQRDPAHSRLSSYVGGRLRRSGWIVRTEVEIGGDRSRGWIDIVAMEPRTGVMLIIELKTEIHDLGEIQRQLGWYERASEVVARREGWRPRRRLGCLLLLATTANDARTAANRAAIDMSFPVRASSLGLVMSGQTNTTPPGRAIAMVDPRSRRVAWARPLRIDGRRSPAPYTDYADFMRRAERPTKARDESRPRRSVRT